MLERLFARNSNPLAESERATRGGLLQTLAEGGEVALLAQAMLAQRVQVSAALRELTQEVSEMRNQLGENRGMLENPPDLGQPENPTGSQSIADLRFEPMFGILGAAVLGQKNFDKLISQM